MSVKVHVERLIHDALRALAQQGLLPEDALPATIPVETPKRAEHGDFATSICLQLAKAARKNPRELATALSAKLEGAEGVASIEIAGPGFVNVRLTIDTWLTALASATREGARFGRSQAGLGRRVLVEYVSANPTGPMHVGHGRGAVIGDVLSNLLDWAGYRVEREYYENDVGNQMNKLTRSVLFRARELLGLETGPVPEDCYPGAYLIPVAEAARAALGDGIAHVAPEDEPALTRVRDFARDRLVGEIRGDLERLGVRHETWFREHTLHDSGAVSQAAAELEARGHVYTDDSGKRWFRSTDFGDDEDRVVVRENGVPTYFAADIAYHKHKMDRGYDCAIDVWGADHHGYIPRVRASIAALGYDVKRFEVLLCQFVTLVENGQPVRMGKRSGNFETLRDLLDEVGVDATRFGFVMRSADAQFEFDLALAKSQSMENPVYYVQYGHARLAQILAKAAELGHAPPSDGADLRAIVLPEELGLIKKAMEWPDVVRAAADQRAPHFVVFYLQELIGLFHGYYTKYKATEKVVSDDAAKTAARLVLCQGLKTVIGNGLAVLGVSAPERMYFTE